MLVFSTKSIMSSLSLDPVADVCWAILKRDAVRFISRTVLDLDSVRFALCQKLHSATCSRSRATLPVSGATASLSQ
jgi:hypothetical protein